jgi:restriction system protein
METFEDLCAGYFTKKGYKAEVSRQGADGGIDIFLYKESYSSTKVFGVAWNTYKVGVKPVRELFGVMTAEQAPLGVFMTSGTLTQEAELFAQGKPLKLLTGKSLLELLKSLSEDSQQSLLSEISAGDYTTPSCPSCGTKTECRE